MRIKPLEDALKDATTLWEMGSVLQPVWICSTGKEIVGLLEEAKHQIGDLLEEKDFEVLGMKGMLNRALNQLSGSCSSCAFLGDCSKHYNNDSASATWYYDCGDWKWNGYDEYSIEH